MLASLIRDAAIAAAKGHNHGAVEPRHVYFAAVRHFKGRPEIAALLARAKNALDPRGAALEVPKVTPDAEALLESFVAEPNVIAAVVAFFSSESSDGGGQDGRNAKDSQGPNGQGQNGPDGDDLVALLSQTAEQPAVPPNQPPPRPTETVAAVMAELDSLVGLASVKRQLASVIAVVQANAERSKAGMTQVTAGLHLVFTGPPGTGKTTVARLVARLYAAAGALPGSNFTETGRHDLVAPYVGQTALKTTEVIEKTRPGVLFIDEAYALTPTHPSDFGAEAIATLVKAMEDYRAELAVVVAGYGDEMTEFVGSNPGLKSRFKTFIQFPNYAPDELTRIFEGFAKGAGIALQDGVLDAALAVFKRVVAKRDFGNARFARSLFEHAYSRMAARAVADGSVTVDEVSAIHVVDIEWEDTDPDRGDVRVGFSRS